MPLSKFHIVDARWHSARSNRLEVSKCQSWLTSWTRKPSVCINMAFKLPRVQMPIHTVITSTQRLLLYSYNYETVPSSRVYPNHLVTFSRAMKIVIFENFEVTTFMIKIEYSYITTILYIYLRTQRHSPVLILLLAMLHLWVSKRGEALSFLTF